jgi:hypothetical protein
MIYASGRNTATNHTKEEIKLANKQETKGEPISKENDIPSVIMADNASDNSKNGQTKNIRSSELEEACDLCKSETKKCNAEEAMAKSIIDSAGSHSQIITSFEYSTDLSPIIINQDR